ncbi:MAG: hypothetical protein H0U49_00530 [Parachlamydiaceae bacterium]|nr:hypothetical protein [Parachlamydiaceae bacterium]
MKHPLVQILVVVANIQMRSLKTEVGKGSMRTVVGHWLAGPKFRGNSVIIVGKFTEPLLTKGNQVNIPEP